jgi:hypothetical protein
MINKEQKKINALNKSTKNFNERIDFKKSKFAERHTRTASSRQFNLSDRDEKLKRIVTDYHIKIDDQVKQRLSSRKMSSMVKRAVRDEWIGINTENLSYLRDIRAGANDQII